MKMIDLKCAQCGGNTKIEDNNRLFCFCSCCGTRIDIEAYKKIQAASILQPENAEDEVRLKELEIEKEKVTLKGTLIKVWVFIVVALAVAAIEILLRDKDNPNSLGYLLLLIDFNAVMWPAIFLLTDKNKKEK